MKVTVDVERIGDKYAVKITRKTLLTRKVSFASINSYNHEGLSEWDTPAQIIKYCLFNTEGAAQDKASEIRTMLVDIRNALS